MGVNCEVKKRGFLVRESVERERQDIKKMRKDRRVAIKYNNSYLCAVTEVSTHQHYATVKHSPIGNKMLY